jgi:hypothetical protein
MTIENGGEQPANDTALTVNEQPGFKAALAEENNQGAGDQAPEVDDDGNPIVSDETEELEWDGKKWVLPKDAATTLKPALLRQADYTQKTQALADERRAHETREAEFKTSMEVQRAHFQAATKIAALDDQLAPYAKLSPQEWMNLHASDPAAYEQHRVNYDFLKNQRDAVARDFSEKERARAENENRERGNQVQKVQAEIARLIPEWTPGNEVDLKLTRYGIEQGLSKEDMAHAILRQPKFALALKRLHDYDEAAKKQKTQQTFEKTQQAQPVTRVGGSGGSLTRKTTDKSGDALPTAEWIRREQERVRPKRA